MANLDEVNITSNFFLRDFSLTGHLEKKVFSNTHSIIRLIIFRFKTRVVRQPLFSYLISKLN